jgi:hypothetical protein
LNMFSSIFEFHFFIHSRLPASHPSWRITFSHSSWANVFSSIWNYFSHPSWISCSHPSSITLSHPFWITLFSCIQDCPVSSINPDHPFLMHPGLPCLIHPSWPPFSHASRIALSHPSILTTLFSCIQDCPVSSIDPDDLFKIHPWGGLVGQPLMTVYWKSSGHMLSQYESEYFAVQVVFVREWKSRYNLVVEIRL